LTGKEVKDWSRPVFGVPEGWTGYALAVEKTHWVGEPVAVIAASDRYIAEDALELIDVEYEPLEPVVDALKAGSPSAPNVLDGQEARRPPGQMDRRPHRALDRQQQPRLGPPLRLRAGAQARRHDRRHENATCRRPRRLCRVARDRHAAKAAALSRQLLSHRQRR